LTWILDDEPETLMAYAFTSNDERSQGQWEHSQITFTLKRSGVRATLINGRIAPSYDHRLDIYCEKGIIQVLNPSGEGAIGVAFHERFKQSYIHQMEAFVHSVAGATAASAVAALATPAALASVELTNLSLERTRFLARLVDACEQSAAAGGIEVPVGPGLRSYGKDTACRVRDLYRTMRSRQTYQHAMALRTKYGQLGSLRMSMWEALDSLEGFVDVSDPDVDLPNLVHLFQTAESIRAAGLPEWLQLTGLIHDVGKMIYLRGSDEDGTSVGEQWAVVGDTFVLGCTLPDCTVFPEFNKLHPDRDVPEFQGELGIYSPSCGLDAVVTAYGHDEYLYQVLVQNEGVKLPAEALYVVRFHSLYPWHTGGAYAALESSMDRERKAWVLLFNQHDLYTKRNVMYTTKEMGEMRAYYTKLIDKFLPPTLAF